MRRLAGGFVLTLLALSACSAAEPAPTACPVPTVPDVTTSPEGATPPATAPSDSICSGESLPAADAFTLLQGFAGDVTIIDTRTPAEYDSGHIPGAVSMSTQDAAFWNQVDELPSDGTYLLYCRTGSTTRRVVEQMRAIGFTDVCHISDGFNGWRNRGLPVEAGSA